MISSLSIWGYVVNVKSTVKISSIYVAFLEIMNCMAQIISKTKVHDFSPYLEFCSCIIV